MSEAKYWEAYDKAKQEALKMAAQLSAHEKGVMVTALKRGLIDEAKWENRGKREILKHLVSLDFPYEDGVRYEYNDGCFSVNRLYYNLDEPYRIWRRCRKLEAAFEKLEDSPALWMTLLAICSFRGYPREQIAPALGISQETYERYLRRVRKKLDLST